MLGDKLKISTFNFDKAQFVFEDDADLYGIVYLGRSFQDTEFEYQDGCDDRANLDLENEIYRRALAFQDELYSEKVDEWAWQNSRGHGIECHCLACSI